MNIHVTPTSWRVLRVAMSSWRNSESKLKGFSQLVGSTPIAAHAGRTDDRPAKAGTRYVGDCWPADLLTQLNDSGGKDDRNGLRAVYDLGPRSKRRPYYWGSLTASSRCHHHDYLPGRRRLSVPPAGDASPFLRPAPTIRSSDRSHFYAPPLTSPVCSSEPDSSTPPPGVPQLRLYTAARQAVPPVCSAGAPSGASITRLPKASAPSIRNTDGPGMLAERGRRRAAKRT